MRDPRIDLPSELEVIKEARRAAERKYRQIFENAGEGIFQSTPNGYYLTANPALARMHGFGSPEELIQSCRDISREIYVDPARRDEFKRLLDEHGFVRAFEHETFRKDGQRVWVSVNARAVRDEAGRIMYYEGTAQDITERKREEQALRKSEEHYRELFENLKDALCAARNYSRLLIEAQEAERRRVSIELHDQVGQILTAVKMNLHSLKQTSTAPEIIASINDNMMVIDEAVDQVRDLSVDLRPLLLDDFGLVVALRWYLQARNYGFDAEFFSNSLSEETRFAWELETACFRIVQEAVTNAARHAKASKVFVVLEKAGSELVLTISDDGIGFDLKVLRSSAATLGLRGMEERVHSLGGSITIDSTPEVGTEVCARFPAESSHKKAQTAQIVF